MTNSRFGSPLARVTLAVLLLGSVSWGQASSSQRLPQTKGPGKIIVYPKFGGKIFGFDIDQNGREGLLSESVVNGNNCPYATETFAQATGKIIKVVSEGQSAGCADDEVTWGVAGSSVGLVERQHSPGVGHNLRMTFKTLNPLEQNRINGTWLPPQKKAAYILGVSRNQGTPINAYQVYDVNTEMVYAFGSDVGKNTFGPVIQIASNPGMIGLNVKTNVAVLAGEDGSGTTEVIQADLTTGDVTSFLGVGNGSAMGLAVDSENDTAVVATFYDASVAFYDLKNQTGFSEVLPGIPQNCDNACTADDVEFDPLHKLFLVAQPLSSQCSGGCNYSTIYVYDIQGNLVETLNGFDFTGAFFADPFNVHMALYPKNRRGFVDVIHAKEAGAGAIQSFTY